MTALSITDLLVRGAGISSCLFFCAILLTQGPREQTVWRGFLYALCVAAFLIWSAEWFDQIPTQLGVLVLALTLLNPLFFWLASRALFNDSHAFTAVERVVSFGFLVLVVGLATLRFSKPIPNLELLTNAYRLAALALVIICISEMIRSYSDDLLGARRRLRVYLFAVLGTYLVALFVVRILFPDGQAPLWATTINASVVTLLVMFNNFVCMRFREDLLPRSVNPRASETTVEGTTPPESDLAQKVVEAMERDFLYRDPKLSIATLAEQLGTQEYRLRRAINQRLGYRNFSQFLNSFRLQETREALSDRSRYHQSILTLAYESGFNSIGPFNRTFKDKYGITPSEYRQSSREND